MSNLIKKIQSTNSFSQIKIKQPHKAQMHTQKNDDNIEK